MKGCGYKLLLSINTGRNLSLPREHLENLVCVTEGYIASNHFIISHGFSPSRLQQWSDSVDSSVRRVRVKDSSIGISNDFFPVFRQPAFIANIFRRDCDSDRLRRSTAECNSRYYTTSLRVCMMKKIDIYNFIVLCTKEEKYKINVFRHISQVTSIKKFTNLYLSFR